MIRVHSLDEIHHVEDGVSTGEWHFSFRDYRNPQRTRFGALHVFNVETLAPGATWPMRYEENMELVLYCIDGRLRYVDSLGNDHVLVSGGVQHVTLGSGLEHSEINGSDTDYLTFIHMRLWPTVRGMTPKIQQRHVPRDERLDRWVPLASSRHEAAGALPLGSDAEVWGGTLGAGHSIPFAITQDYGAYLHLARGGPVHVSAGSDGCVPERLEHGWAAEITDVRLVRVTADEQAELVLVKVRP